MTTARRLAAILAADVAGYSRLMGADEVGTLAALKAARREVVDPAIAAHRGRIVKTTGDGMLVEFASAVDAVTCAMAVQETMAGRGGNIVFRIGINVGDIIIDGDDIFGDGVNVAARVEGECEPGGVYLSDDAFRQVRAKTPFSFDDLGERSLKNIDRPVRIYAACGISNAPAGAAFPEPGTPLPLPDKPSIAVLPFQNMSGDPEQEYFCDGMVEDIITALSRFKELFVIARNSSFTYKGKLVDIKQVGRELGVRYVLEGSVRKAGQRARITGQLIDAESGAHLWADKFEGTLDDIFELQDSVTRNVVGAIAPRLVEAKLLAAKRKPPEKWDSYDHYFRALSLFYQGDLASVVEARKVFQAIVDSDPTFAPAYVGVALQTQNIALVYNQPISEAEKAKALEYADRAIRLSPDDENVLARAAFVVGMMNAELDRGHELAIRATSLNANSAQAWNARGTMELILGELEACLAAFANAMRLNPLDPRAVPYALFGSGGAYLLSGRYAEGASAAKRMLQLIPNDIRGLFILIGNMLEGGQIEEADGIIATFRHLFPHVRASHLRRSYGVRKPQHMAVVERIIARMGLSE
jgi:adenylate cyclase